MFIEEKFFITFVKYFLSIKNIQSANDQCDYQQLAVSLWQQDVTLDKTECTSTGTQRYIFFIIKNVYLLPYNLEKNI